MSITQGPWIYNYFYKVYVKGKEMHLVSDSEGETIAGAYSKSDALTIALVPTMIETLKEALDYIKVSTGTEKEQPEVAQKIASLLEHIDQFDKRE